MSDPSAVGPDTTALPDLSALSLVEAELDDVARALQRLDDGTYGTCEVCAAAIADEQLDAAPASLRCPAHAGS